MNAAILNWIRPAWDRTRSNLWLTPGILFLLGIVLALMMLALDRRYPEGGEQWLPWIGSGSGDDARNLLSTLLTSVIAMASIVFSVTVVSLSLAANSYGPRLIRTFRASRQTQIALGIFMMTIVYLLLVLRELRGSAEPAEVPAIAVTTATLLSLLCVLALLAFIQGVSTLIVADEVVRRVRRELDGAIDALPLLADEMQAPPHLPDDFEERASRIRLPREGYVQSVEYEALIQWAEKHDAVVRLDFRPGDFVVDGDHRVLVYPAPSDAEKTRREIDRFIVNGDERTPTQDLEYAIRHLVEVAVRALSPGINDPFTAMAVIDRLRGGLARLCRHQLPPKRLAGRDGRLRLSRDATGYAGAVDAAFHQIRQAGSAKPSIMLHMLKALRALAEHVQTEEQRDVLIRHAQLVKAAGRRDIEDQSDRDEVERAYRRTVSALSRNSTVGPYAKPGA